jgi:hypothetical protein
LASDKVSFFKNVSAENALADRKIYPQPYLTELDLRMALLPQGSIDYLLQAMPRSRMEGIPEDAYDYDSYLGKVSITLLGAASILLTLPSLLVALLIKSEYHHARQNPSRDNISSL